MRNHHAVVALEAGESLIVGQSHRTSVMTRESSIISAIFLLPAMILHCNAPSSFQQVSGSVSGIVCDARDSIALEGANIRLVGSEISTQTGPDGEFSLTDLSTGEAVLHITKDEYAARTKTASVAAGQNTEMADAIYLCRAYAILAGVVLGSDSSSGISEAAVYVRNSENKAIVDSTTTNTEGGFSFNLPQPDTSGYVIRIEKSGYKPLSFRDTIVSGDSIHVTQYVQPYLHVSGMIFEANSTTPVRDVLISTGDTTATTDSLGRFTFARLVPADSGHRFTAEKEHFHGLSFRDTITARDTVVGPVFLQRKTGTVQGTLKLQGQTNHAGIVVQIGTPGIVDTTDSLGSFFWSGVPAGTQRIIAAREKFSSLSDTIVAAGNDTTHFEFDLAIQTGSIQTRVDWYPGGSPYIISDTLEVTNSGTLYVHPAVEIQMANASLLLTTDNGLVSMKGTPESLITVSPASGITTSPKIDIGFHVQDTSMAYTMIVNTTVYCRQGPRMYHCLFVDSGRTSADTGLHVLPSNSGAVFDHCDFIRMSSNTAGIFVRDSTFAVDDGACEVLFSNCIFYHAADANPPFLMSNNGGNIQTGLANCNFHFGGTFPDSLYAIAQIDTQQIWQIDPLYKNPGQFDFHLQDSSALAGKSTDNGHIGALGVSTMQYFEPRERPRTIR